MTRIGHVCGAAALVLMAAALVVQAQEIDQQKLVALLKLPDQCLELKASVDLDDIYAPVPAAAEQQLQALQKQLKDDPRDHAAKLKQAELLRQLHRRREAREASFEAVRVLKPLVRANPQNWALAAALGQAEAGAGELQDAVAHLESALNHKPDLWTAYPLLADCYLDQIMAFALARRGDLAQATAEKLRAFSDQAVKRAPSDSRMYVLRAKSAMALLAFSSPRDEAATGFEAVIADLRKGAELAPDNARLALTAIGADLALGRLRAPLDPFQPTWQKLTPEQQQTVVAAEKKVIAIRDAHPEVLSEAAHLLVLAALMQDKPDAAEAYLKQAAEQAGTGSGLRLDLAALHIRLEQREKAEAALEATKACRQQGRWHCLRAHLWEAQGKHEEAAEEYRKAAIADARIAPMALMGRAVSILRAQGDATQAVRAAQKACERRSAKAEAELVLGVAHALAGNLDFARLHINKAVRMAPDEPRYKQAQTLLSGSAGAP